MKWIAGKKPYLGYKVWKIFHRKNGRFYAVLVSAERKTTIAWAKYILETSLGRNLRTGFEAHHKNDDKADDHISNLEEVDAVKHKLAHGRRTKGRCLIVDCPCCGKRLVKLARHTHIIKGGLATYCSRRCSGTGPVKIQLPQEILRDVRLTEEERAALRAKFLETPGR